MPAVKRMWVFKLGAELKGLRNHLENEEEELSTAVGKVPTKWVFKVGAKVFFSHSSFTSQWFNLINQSNTQSENMLSKDKSCSLASFQFWSNCLQTSVYANLSAKSRFARTSFFPVELLSQQPVPKSTSFLWTTAPLRGPVSSMVYCGIMSVSWLLHSQMLGILWFQSPTPHCPTCPG